MDYQGTMSQRQTTDLTMSVGRAKPSTLFPTENELKDMERGVSSPIPGSDWDADEVRLLPTLPTLYSDATKLNTVLEEITHDAQHKQWQLGEALRNLRIAESEAEKASATTILRGIYSSYMKHADMETRVRLHVNELANTIEEDRERPIAVSVGNKAVSYPSMDRYYTLRPVWGFINKVRAAFKRSDG